MRKVLIADDEEKVCQLIVGLVPWAELGLDVVGTARDGLTALSMLESLAPDILITDIRMPGLDGISLIQRAKAIRPNLRCVIISGYRHFDYAHNAIKFGVQDYLLKPLQKRELVETLRKLLNEAPGEGSPGAGQGVAALYADCAWGRVAGPDLTPEAAQSRYGLPLSPTAPYRALLVKADLTGVSARDTVRRIAAEKLLDACRRAVKPLAAQLYEGALESGVAVLLEELPDKEAELIVALETLRDRMELMRDLFPTLRVSIGLSGRAMGARAVRGLFGQAAHAMAQRLLRADGAVYVYQPRPPCTLALADALGPGLQRNLSLALQALGAPAYGGLLREAFARMREAAGDDLPALRAFLREVVRFHFEQLPLATPLREMEAAMAECDDLWEVSLTLAQLEEGFVSLLAGRLARVEEEQKQREQLPLRKAKAYIREHYREPLTLEKVSDVAGFNPAYFSTLFKKETGERFLEYLASVRIKAARRLLTDSDLSVPAIAEETGYGDYKHFCKQFKKITGLSPQEYRKLYG